MEGAVLVRDDLGLTYWEYNGVVFLGLCKVLKRVLSVGDCSLDQFMQDSKKILNKDLKDSEFWFTRVGGDEPKARKERVEHLESLIKLYEDGK